MTLRVPLGSIGGGDELDHFTADGVRVAKVPETGVNQKDRAALSAVPARVLQLRRLGPQKGAPGRCPSQG